MSQPPPNTTLSLSARLLTYIGPPSAILFTFLASPMTGLISPLAFLPTTYAYRKWANSNKQNPQRRGELEPMIYTYALAGTVGLLGVSLIQMGVVKVVSFFLFYHDRQASKDFWTEFFRVSIEGLKSNELAKRAGIAWSWKNWVLNGALTFIGAGLGEEILKYLPIIYARRRDTGDEMKKRNRAYVDYALAGALSFALVENIGFLYSSVETGNQSWSRLAWSGFERVIIGGTGHITVAVLTALRAIRRDYYGDQLSWLQVIGPAVLYHGTSDFVCFGTSAWEGNVGWIHPTGLGPTSVLFGSYLGLLGAAMWQTSREWRVLEEKDRMMAASKNEKEK
jgi:hypothetical protein